MMATRRSSSVIRAKQIAMSFLQHHQSKHSAVNRSMALSNNGFTAPSPLTYVRVDDALFRLRRPFPDLAPETMMKPLAAVAITACRVAPSGLQWLMIKRGKAPSRGEWSLPGGSVELGENTLAAAKRELFEETGISESQAIFCADPFMCSDSITRDSNGRMQFHYLIAQVFAAIDPGAVPTAGDDALDVAWFTAEEIEAERRGRVTADVARVVRRAEALRRAGCLPLPAADVRWLLGSDGGRDS